MPERDLEMDLAKVYSDARSAAELAVPHIEETFIGGLERCHLAGLSAVAQAVGMECAKVCEAEKLLEGLRDRADIAYDRAMSEQFTVEWMDSGREPQCPPDPSYPNGKPLLLADQFVKHCTVPLPYPAKRCGVYIIECSKCGLRVGVTTAGRPDDPHTLQIACGAGEQNMAGFVKVPNV